MGKTNKYILFSISGPLCRRVGPWPGRGTYGPYDFPDHRAEPL